ncbi:MAG: T9SS type A sorting domain-containing protein [Ignavibacteriae bacterium]|nr:T9SS type A sorting domain-containing protein [Ignavibacteriota bacterium]
MQITEVNDTNFLSGFKSGPLTALPGATASYITSVSDINLIAYKTYQFRFRSFNAADSSNWSVPGTFKRDSLSVLRQAFADATFPPFPWSTSINNDTVPPLSTFWLRATVGGNTTTNTAAKFDFWNAPYGKLRSLISNSFAPRYSGADDTLYFEVAHAYKNTVNIDTLFIYTSINYGTTWGTSPIRTLVSSQVFNDSTLSTTTSTTEFTPSQTTHWKTIKFLVNPEVKKIKFECLSSNGNNLYITNVRLGPSLTGEMLTLNEPPKQYELHLNYPNPFNPTTTISYAIPKTSLTKLVIYDVLGREIVKLVNEVKNPGNYSITFNANNLASGVYFYRLEAGDFVDVKKMLLIK